MESNNFLEEYPLYRKLHLEMGTNLHPNALKTHIEETLYKPIHTSCLICKKDRTFNNTDRSRSVWSSDEWVKHNSGGYSRTVNLTYHLVFQCTFCNTFQRTYTVLTNHVDKFLQKVGQYPSWEIAVDKDTSDNLGDDSKLFKNGLVCESQGYGIAAYSYYRRIVEIHVDKLLDEISLFLSGNARTEYNTVLDQIKDETVAAKKIELAKELLPDSLRPGGLNPLDAIYEALSRGIHKLSDEDCLELASAIKTSLVYLIKRTAESKRESEEYISSVQKILDRKKSKG